jgi:para-nitrobenzyl esterase
MVVVIIQYRLGPLGWFNHPALKVGATPEESSGNFGTLDTVKALKWVHDNIKAFGGNPDNITIAGESAGAHNVMNLLVSPLGKGLFHRAISESGGMTILPVTSGIASANSTIEKLLVADGTVPDNAAAATYRENMTSAQTASYLRGKDALQVVQAQMNAAGSMDTHAAYEDGVVIPGSWLSVIASGNYNRVPVILGSNEYETKIFMPLFGGTRTTSSGNRWSDLLKVIDGQLTLDQVMPLQSDRDLYEACGYYGARNWKAKYVDSIARQLKEKQDDVYCYFFKWGGPGSVPKPFDFIFAASHGMEIPFFFGWDSGRVFTTAFTEQNRPGSEQLQTAIMAYVAQFAATGNPDTPSRSLPQWQKWSNVTGEPKCIVFDASYTEAKISMMTSEVTVESVKAEVDALPDAIK